MYFSTQPLPGTFFRLLLKKKFFQYKMTAIIRSFIFYIIIIQIMLLLLILLLISSFIFKNNFYLNVPLQHLFFDCCDQLSKNVIHIVHEYFIEYIQVLYNKFAAKTTIKLLNKIF